MFISNPSKKRTSSSKKEDGSGRDIQRGREGLAVVKRRDSKSSGSREEHRHQSQDRQHKSRDHQYNSQSYQYGAPQGNAQHTVSYDPVVQYASGPVYYSEPQQIQQIQGASTGIIGEVECNCKDEISTSISKDDLKVTFENLVSMVKTGDQNLSPESVAEMLSTLYSWMVFDPNQQISIPCPQGSKCAKKMWPQGSKIDTRRKRTDSANDSSPLKLKDVDKECLENVAGSVVSSTLEEERGKMNTGKIMYGGPSHFSPGFAGSAPTHYPQEPYRYNPVPETVSLPSYHTAVPVSRPIQLPTPRQSSTVSDEIRYSINGTGGIPLERLQDSPMPSHAEATIPVRQKKTKIVRRPKAGSAPRAIREDDSEDIQWEQ